LFLIVTLLVLILLFSIPSKHPKKTKETKEKTQPEQRVQSKGSLDQEILNNKVHITLANFKHIIYQSNIKDAPASIEFVFSEELKPYLNWFELKTLAIFNVALSDFTNYHETIYKPQKKRIDTETLIYEGAPSAFHIHSNCENLNKEYFNFKIPQEIKDKGLVQEFRVWFNTVRNLLEEGRYDVFTARLYSKYGILTNEKAINIENSGSIAFDPDSVYLTALRITNILRDIENEKKRSTKMRVILDHFAKVSYFGSSKKGLVNNTTGYSDAEVKLVLREFEEKFKHPLVYAVEQHLIVKHNPSFDFKREILINLGFRACRNCEDVLQEEAVIETRIIKAVRNNSEDDLPF